MDIHIVIQQRIPRILILAYFAAIEHASRQPLQSICLGNCTVSSLSALGHALHSLPNKPPQFDVKDSAVHAQKLQSHGEAHNADDVDPALADHFNGLPDEVKVGGPMGVELLGSIVVYLGLFYMLRHHDAQVAAYSHKILFATTSIFCALVIEKMEHEFVLRGIVPLNTPRVAIELIQLLLFIFHFALVTLAVYACRTSHELMFGVGAIFSHVCAFVGIHLFYDWLRYTGEQLLSQKGHGNLLALYAVAPVFGLKLFAVFIGLSKCLRCHMIRWSLDSAGTQVVLGEGSDGQHRHHDENHHGDGSSGRDHRDAALPAWAEEAGIGEIEACAIFVGFLLNRLCVLLVTGEVPPMQCNDHAGECNQSWAQIGQLFLLITLQWLVIGVLPVVFGFDSTFVNNTQMGLSYSVGWCLNTAVRWMLLGNTDKGKIPVPGGRAGIEMTCAFLGSPVVCLAIIAIDYLADRNILSNHAADVFTEAVGLFIGILWETAFVESAEFAVHSSDWSRRHSLLCNLVGGAALILFILPAWRLWLVPVASEPVPKRTAASPIKCP